MRTLWTRYPALVGRGAAHIGACIDRRGAYAKRHCFIDRLGSGRLDSKRSCHEHCQQYDPYNCIAMDSYEHSISPRDVFSSLKFLSLQYSEDSDNQQDDFRPSGVSFLYSEGMVIFVKAAL
jgi:hypothetical protein